MKYEGKVYGKVAGRYIELTQTVKDLENKIEELETDAIVKENHKLFNDLLFRSEMELLLRDIYNSMDHASIFISSRQKMHPSGQELRRALTSKVREKIVEISDSLKTD